MFETRVQSCVRASQENMFVAPQTTDPHAIVFSPYDPKVHDPVRQELKRADKGLVTPEGACEGMSWVQPGTMNIFSKEASWLSISSYRFSYSFGTLVLASQKIPPSRSRAGPSPHPLTINKINFYYSYVCTLISFRGFCRQRPMPSALAGYEHGGKAASEIWGNGTFWSLYTSSMTRFLLLFYWVLYGLQSVIVIHLKSTLNLWCNEKLFKKDRLHLIKKKNILSECVFLEWIYFVFRFERKELMFYLK